MLHQSPAIVPLLGPRTFAQFQEGLASADIRLTPEIVETLNGAGD
jgi:aryl-alcohol dehydrogenase-like predicted oxidoreductase